MFRTKELIGYKVHDGALYVHRLGKCWGCNHPSPSGYGIQLVGNIATYPYHLHERLVDAVSDIGKVGGYVRKIRLVRLDDADECGMML
ncbi:hypothetical protein N9L86_04770 [Euryarchaeota archaeon]|nr:hypothetical protein [Euryarchaeota archaeon]MDC3236212.1 hypothetical protein [Candidatus Poseidoniaceae archaeon]